MLNLSRIKLVVSFLFAFFVFCNQTNAQSVCANTCSGIGTGSIEWTKDNSSYKDRRSAKFVVVNHCTAKRVIHAEYKNYEGKWSTLASKKVDGGGKFSSVGYNVSIGTISWRWKIYGPECTYSDRPDWSYE